MVVRVTEVDHHTHEYSIIFDADTSTIEVPCNSRVKRPRKKKGVPLDETEDGKKNEPIPILYVRFDPNLEWLHHITVKQPEYMWHNQLQEDMDVFSQYEVFFFSFWEQN